MIENGANLALDVAAREDTPANSYGISLQRKALSAYRFPETSALFGSRTVEKVTEKFFAGQPFDYNGDLFVQWTDHTDVPASGALHWDKQLTLKSWLYVTDATDGYGPMRAGVGTAAWTRYIREDAMFDGVPYGKIVNQVQEKGFPVVSTGGPAGTFFLFATDTAHGATSVDPGKRRNILRARSRPHRVKQWSAWAHKL
ncbi:MAG: phytanoyl-CoA dioxygenase family protein [Roseobacter sp.]